MWKVQEEISKRLFTKSNVVAAGRKRDDIKVINLICLWNNNSFSFM